MRSGESRGVWLRTLVILTFVIVFNLITVTSFLQKSPTFDEAVHLFAGYSYLKWGDFRTNPEHPPLAKTLAALPLMAFDIKDPRPASTQWDLISKEKDYAIANQMVFFDNDADTLFFYAKLPMIALGILLGVFVYIWAKQLYGFKAAMAALFIYCLDPNILAHSHIIHTDLPFSTFFFISSYFFWRALGHLTWSNLFLTSSSFGAAAVTKFSFLTLLPIWVILGLLGIFSSKSIQCSVGASYTVSSRRGKTVLIMAIMICALITAYLFIWAAYGFRFNAIAGGAPHLPMDQMMPENPFLQELVSFSNYHHLFPEAWTYGVISVLQIFRRLTFLWGRLSEDGFWLYFPVAFAVKTPLPTILLLAATVGVWIFKPRGRRSELFVLLPIIAYFCLAVGSRVNIGLRHLLPIYPLLFVLLGGTVVELWKANKWAVKGSLAVLAFWYLWSCLNIYPHYLAYFNELAGGARNGYKFLTDSSLDWGQDLKGLKRWMDKNGVKKIGLAYFGTAEPIYYGIDALYLPGSIIFSPRPESKDPEVPKYLAVSATYLQGAVPDKVLREVYRPFRSRQPVATIGHSIFVYTLE